ncbi:MAG: gluconate 2-dehydrogenase subunit 3 family protein [Gammaproteobacteria bacterium]|nr:gluconate 2-dehydrogenase subunit 3 family protein [Gammaproteobacteria bacterium]
MLKGAENKPKNDKRGAIKSGYQGALASGLNRRAFLRSSVALSLLSGLAACNLSLDEQDDVITISKAKDYFEPEQQQILDAVQMQLFPADGDGPSARDLNALAYLEWAMTDPENIDDGDPSFIVKGIGWLDDLSKQTLGTGFIKLTSTQQDTVLKQVAGSNQGESWLSLLMYYLAEALMLDPIYGGNPNGIGWQWLQHQAGFPAPVAGKTYRDFT